MDFVSLCQSTVPDPHELGVKWLGLFLGHVAFASLPNAGEAIQAIARRCFGIMTDHEARQRISQSKFVHSLDMPQKCSEQSASTLATLFLDCRPIPQQREGVRLGHPLRVFLRHPASCENRETRYLGMTVPGILRREKADAIDLKIARHSGGEQAPASRNLQGHDPALHRAESETAGFLAVCRKKSEKTLSR